MNNAELIGKVAAEYLRQQLLASDVSGAGESLTTARFILDCLSAEQTAATAMAVLTDSELSAAVDIKLPAHFLVEYDLPEFVLTDRRATYYRNAACEKRALLLANVGDDEQQSLKELVPIGASELFSRPEIWVKVANENIDLTADAVKWWTKALSGLRDLRMLSPERLAEYVLRTRREIRDEGLPLISALGAALPALHISKNSAYFNSLNETTRNHASRWKTLFDALDKKFAPYLQKLTPNQIALTEGDLQKTFEKVRESVPENVHPSVEKFIKSSSGWNTAAAELAEYEWEFVAPLFDGFRREKFNLAEETARFYDDREPEQNLSAEEREYLKLLTKRKTSGASIDEDFEFFNQHRNELKDDRKLKSAWDRFVYGTPLETEDFLVGIVLCCERLFSKDRPAVSRMLKIRCDRTTKRDLKDLNVSAGLNFATRYGGVKKLFGRLVTWETGRLFDFPALITEWKSNKTKLNDSSARAALQLKFVLELEVEFEDGGTQKYSTQLLWKFNPNTVANEFAEDWRRLAAHPFVRCSANRDPINNKGQFQTVDLSNIKTFVPAYGQDRGSFVPAYKAHNDLAVLWTKNLTQAFEQRLISEETRNSLSQQFERFRDNFSQAVTNFLEEGINNSSLIEQLRSFSTLLDTLSRQAKGDLSRELLLRPLLQIGIADIIGGQMTTVVLPWHPLRLSAMHRKGQIVSNLLNELLNAGEIDFGDARLFFGDLKEELSHPFYPEIVLGWAGNAPQLLSLSDTVADYSLHEIPVITNEGLDDTNENPTEAAKLVVDLINRYLELHPHESSNLSVVLYNCDSARLPQEVVNKIGSMHVDDEELRCQVILRHRDGKRLRALYEKILEAADENADSFNASEATRDFMARLRIGIMADQAPPPSEKDGLPTDIVFSQDVISRHAQIEWYTEDATPVEFEEWIPSRWSRRRPAAMDDLKSMAYLCCPVQAAEGWNYLTALTSFIKGDWDENETKRLLPVRQLNFRDRSTESIFNETHRLANWVVNYDELLDRRQLITQGVRVIRYKQMATSGRHLIVSSAAPLSLLLSMLLSRLKALNLELSEADYHLLADKFISDAKDISGDIVLRAAKHGRNASELMGVVLSRFLVQREMGMNKYYGWYFLDDYAGWLGQREQQIADVLVLCPEESAEGNLRLSAIITESKYIDAASLSAKRRESQKQLRDTVLRIENAVFGIPERFDRELWLSRLSDLLIDGVQFPASANIDLGSWRRALRNGTCEIFLRGYSHVFISNSQDANDLSDFSHVAGINDCFQEVFSREQVRNLTLQYFLGNDPLSLRQFNAGSENVHIWETHRYRTTRGKDFEVGKLNLSDSMVKNALSLGSLVSSNDAALPKAEADSSLKTENPETHLSESSSVDDIVTILPNLAAEISTTTSALPPASSEQILEVSSANWVSPTVQSLLDTWSAASVKELNTEQTWLKQLETKVKGALQQFQLQAKIQKSILTPNAGLIKFIGSSNLTVEQVSKRRSELLTTFGLNVISVTPEPGVVSIAVERPTRQIIHLPELWKRWNPESTGGNQEILIGVRESDGELLFLSPGKHHAPHTLIAGSTGSGKSVLIQNIILGVAATNTPAQAKIVLIDPKQGVDYFELDGLPHLDGGIIDEQSVALDKLRFLVSEMDNRYSLFKSARANNLAAYNRKVTDEQKLPAIWVVHDEFAEWMMVDDYKEEVTALVGRLGVKARAAGLYLVFAAQRPDANVMPMQLRANLGNRLILRVDSEGTSEIALGERGAERLLGRGHLLTRLEGMPLTYAQVPFVEEGFLEKIVEAIGN
jgi:S-DNA-T family DNA segregation ATPase FtsK/SpoIIIE